MEQTKQETTIILCGGSISYTNLPVGTNRSNAMIPINGKPVISWILDDLLTKGIHQTTVVLRQEDVRLQNFLKWAYGDRMDIMAVPLVRSGTIVESLQAGLANLPTDGLVRIILGDTLITDSFFSPKDFVYTGEVTDSRRWCLVVTDEAGVVTEYIDKQADAETLKTALAGYYHLQHGDYLRTCVVQSVTTGEKELGDVLRRYGSVYPIETRPVEEWYDFGHIDNLVDARRRLLRPRYFNTLTINPVLNTITKVSQHDQKIRDELDWYMQIPKELKVLTPRIVDYEQKDGRMHIVQEYYGYPSLAELYVYGDLYADTWASILRHVMRIHQEFCRFEGELPAEAYATMYNHKTWKRLELLCHQSPFWERLLGQDYVIFNDRVLKNVTALRSEITRWSERLAKTTHCSVIHGDFCFSNILFDVNNQIIRLIDPRGSFGVKGIFGDSRYDVAKLRHSVAGFYDYIASDLFQLEETAAGFQGTIFVNGTSEAIIATFDQLVQDGGYDREEIRFIEGLLFISMVPLHADHPKRQQMMFLTGLTRLNEVISCES